MEIAKLYDPKQVEDKWYSFWKEQGLFNSKPDVNRKPFTMVIPPPNVTGMLHIGHALNNSLQDAIIRWRRMQGYNALWVPGTDHGGIATQNVVEKLLLKAEKKTRHDLGREKFVERMWQWRRETGDTILNQLQKLGCSCDWSRTRFTMDEQCSRAVNEAFVRLYTKGWIYRGNRIVNWCPRCGTALADIEVNHKEQRGHLWHIKYPFKDGSGYLVVATTRPETMLGDTAVAVNPEDERYKNIVGKIIILPLTNREIPVIADAVVDKEFGTGAVKVTPAHDLTDFEIAERNKLPQIIVIDKKGMMTKEAGEKYAGLDRYKCRKQVIEDLESQELLLKTEDYTNSVGHCYRCDTVIEPLVSWQWFLKTNEMAETSIKASKDKLIEFYPESWEKPYLAWMENLRDWCISRQIWWGHRIPIWYCTKCNHEQIIVTDKENYCIEQVLTTSTGVVASATRPDICSGCGGTDFVQDPDVLDTWFSSALWPFSVLGWPEQNDDVKYYYPTSVLITGYEILYLWVARMIMMGLTLNPKNVDETDRAQKIPYSDVYLHGIVRDVHGKKMSKSLGNVIDPLAIRDEVGSDALRFALVLASTPGRDLQLSEDSFTGARNFTNKIWNASRLIFMNLDGYDTNFKLQITDLELVDKWILKEYQQTVKSVTGMLEVYNLAGALHLVYDFFWSKYCDWYLELAKIRLYGDNAKSKQVVRTILVDLLEGTMKLLHPVTPFITEEIWQSLQQATGKKSSEKSIMVSSWPVVNEEMLNFSVSEMDSVMETISAIRNIRSEMDINPGQKVKLCCNIHDKTEGEILKKYSQYISFLVKTESLEFGENIVRPKHAATAVVKGIEIFVPLEGMIDFAKEKERLEKKLSQAESDLNKLLVKLENKNFVDRAPKEEVERVTKNKEEAEQKIAKLRQNLQIVSS